MAVTTQNITIQLEVVSTNLKYIRQIGHLPQVGVNPTNTCDNHLVTVVIIFMIIVILSLHNVRQILWQFPTVLDSQLQIHDPAASLKFHCTPKGSAVFLHIHWCFGQFQDKVENSIFGCCFDFSGGINRFFTFVCQTQPKKGGLPWTYRIFSRDVIIDSLHPMTAVSLQRSSIHLVNQVGHANPTNIPGGKTNRKNQQRKHLIKELFIVYQVGIFFLQSFFCQKSYVCLMFFWAMTPSKTGSSC